MQQGDVNLFQTDDDGEITVEDGIVEMSSGLGTAVYLSLFGGNEDDDGSEGNPFTWWGNHLETEPARQYRSETQHLLQAIPATSGNLGRIEEAANRDLAWMVTEGVATEIAIVVSIPRLNRVKIKIDIDGDNTLEFEENWRLAA